MCWCFQCCRSWGHFLLAAVLLQGVKNSSTFGEVLLRKGGREAKSKSHKVHGFLKISQHRLVSMVCREPGTLCRGDILQLMPALSPAKPTKDLQVNFLPLAYGGIQAVWLASHWSSQRHVFQTSGPRSPTCHYNVAT